MQLVRSIQYLAIKSSFSICHLSNRFLSAIMCLEANYKFTLMRLTQTKVKSFKLSQVHNERTNKF